MQKSFIKSIFIFVAMFGAVAQAQNCNVSFPETTPVSRFLINPDGTVTDLKTGLMWKRCPEGYNFTGSFCQLVSTPYVTWQMALQRAASEVYAGYDDWRVPNIKELTSIVEHRCSNPALNTAIFQELIYSSDDLWSSSPDSRDGDNAWQLDVFSGEETSGSKTTSTTYVLFVRSGL
jgi:hypothetical protein